MSAKNREVGRGRPPFGYTKEGTPIEQELEALNTVSELLRDELVLRCSLC